MENKTKYSGTINYQFTVMYENETLFLHLKSTENSTTNHYKMQYNTESLPYELKKQSIGPEEAYKLLLDRSNFDVDLLNAQIIINLKIIQMFQFDQEINKKVSLKLNQQANAGKSVFDSVLLEMNELQAKFQSMVDEVVNEGSQWDIQFADLRKKGDELRAKLQSTLSNYVVQYNFFCDGAYGRYRGQAKSGVPHGIGMLRWDNGFKYEGEWKDGLFQGIGFMHSVNIANNAPLVTLAQFKDGKLNGIAFQKDTVLLKMEGVYKDNLPKGMWRIYKPTGSYIEEDLMNLIKKVL